MGEKKKRGDRIREKVQRLINQLCVALHILLESAPTPQPEGLGFWAGKMAEDVKTASLLHFSREKHGRGTLCRRMFTVYHLGSALAFIVV